MLRSPHEVHPVSLGRARDTIAGETDIFVPARPGRGTTRSETPHVILTPTSTANDHVSHRPVPFSIVRKGSNLLSDVRTSTRRILCERCGVFSGGNPPPTQRLLGPFVEVRVSTHPPTNRGSDQVPVFSPSFSIAIFRKISMRVGLDTIPPSDAPRKGEEGTEAEALARKGSPSTTTSQPTAGSRGQHAHSASRKRRETKRGETAEEEERSALA